MPIIDQATTLRWMMEIRSVGEADSGVSRPPRILSFVGSRERIGKSLIAANLAAWLARKGYRVLFVEDASRTLPDQPEQPALACLEERLWSVRCGPLADDARRVAERIRAGVGRVDYVLVDSPRAPLEIHEPVLILTPEASVMAEGYSRLKSLKRDAGIRRVGLIVNRVTEGREAVAVYEKIGEVAHRFAGISLEYFGHILKDEKFSRSVGNGKILLDLEGGAAFLRSLELVARRLSAARALAEEASPGRFREEPARIAPANTAALWRALFGERMA